MEPKLSKKSVISRDRLTMTGSSRLDEALALREAGFWVGAIYLAGYAVECFLKAAICKTLDWADMRATFTTHDLELLLVHTGLENQMRSAAAVYDNFRRITYVWPEDRGELLRYRDPAKYTRQDAENFLEWVSGREGVVTWLRGRV